MITKIINLCQEFNAHYLTKNSYMMFMLYSFRRTWYSQLLKLMNVHLVSTYVSISVSIIRKSLSHKEFLHYQCMFYMLCIPGERGDIIGEIDECALGQHRCEHICVNTFNGHYCACHQGYQLDGNGATCSGE